jgi:D-arabinitol 2-dehydrogenase
MRIPNISSHYADVSSPTSIQASIASILASHPQIDHLVTSAGICENFPAELYPYERMHKLWKINVDGTYCFASAVAQHIFARGGKGNMVFIASMSGTIVNVPQVQTPYNVSKAAVRHMVRSLAVEWAQKGIRVNCVSPGYMMTPL